MAIFNEEADMLFVVENGRLAEVLVAGMRKGAVAVLASFPSGSPSNKAGGCVFAVSRDR